MIKHLISYIKASFVIGRLEENLIGVSARSLGDIEVSNIILRMIDENSKKKVLSRILRKDNGRRY